MINNWLIISQINIMKSDNKNFYKCLILRLTLWVICLVGFVIGLKDIRSFNDVINFFIYFTNQSVLAVFLLTTYLLLQMFLNFKNKNIVSGNSFFHTFVLFMITTTMIVFTGLVAFFIVKNTGRQISPPLNIMFRDILFHFVVPILFVIDYIKYVPHINLSYSTSLYFTLFTISYFLVVIIRANIGGLLYLLHYVNYISYYPYPFIDINSLGMVNSITSLIICSCIFFTYSLLLIYFNNKLSSEVKNKVYIFNN